MHPSTFGGSLRNNSNGWKRFFSFFSSFSGLLQTRFRDGFPLAWFWRQKKPKLLSSKEKNDHVESDTRVQIWDRIWTLQIFPNLRIYFSKKKIFFNSCFVDLRKFFRLVKDTINYTWCMKKNRRKRKKVHFFIVCFKILFCRVLTEMLSTHWTNQNVCGVSKFNTFFSWSLRQVLDPFHQNIHQHCSVKKSVFPKNPPWTKDCVL